MWPITIFADECDPSAAGQASFLREEGLDGWDVRNANGRNVLDLADADCEEILAAGIPVQCIGSPVNKVKLDWALHEDELSKVAKACEMAKRLNTTRVRIFTPEGNSWEEVRRWMRPMVDLAEKSEIMLLLENDAVFFSARPQPAQLVLHEFHSAYFKAAFDFANTVLIGYRPMADWFPWIVPFLDTLHIKDAIESEQKIVPAGEGDAQIRDVLKLLAERGWNGPLTLEPHLASAGALGGFSGAEKCRVAHRAIRKILEDIGANA